MMQRGLQFVIWDGPAGANNGVFCNFGTLWAPLWTEIGPTLPKTNVNPISILSDSAGIDIGLTFAALAGTPPYKIPVRTT